MITKIKTLKDKTLDMFNNENDSFTNHCALFIGILGFVYLIISLIVIKQ